MIKETYEFILKGDGVDGIVCWVNSKSAKSALIKICSLQGIEGVVAKAIKALDLPDAIELANKFLEWPIMNIHTIQDMLYHNPKASFIREITDEAEKEDDD